jgi:hypothetical protein
MTHYGIVGSSNSAVTDVFAFMVTVQGAVPLHPPPIHPTNVTGPEAVRVTGVLTSKASSQSEPQSIPPGELVTVPAL